MALAKAVVNSEPYYPSGQWVRVEINGGSWGKGLWMAVEPWGRPGCPYDEDAEGAIIKAAARLIGNLRGARVEASIRALAAEGG